MNCRLPCSRASYTTLWRTWSCSWPLRIIAVHTVATATALCIGFRERCNIIPLDSPLVAELFDAVAMDAKDFVRRAVTAFAKRYPGTTAFQRLREGEFSRGHRRACKLNASASVVALKSNTGGGCTSARASASTRFEHGIEQLAIQLQGRFSTLLSIIYANAVHQ